MSIDRLLTRYALNARAQGLNPTTVIHVKRVVGFFTDFLGEIPDVRKVIGDDLKRFIVAMQQKQKWALS